MDTVPIPCSQVLVEQGDDGLVVLGLSRFRWRWMNFLLSHNHSLYIRVPLDKMGNAVWQLINGHRTVDQIAEVMQDFFPYEDDIPVRVSLYIQQLHKDGFIWLAIC